MKTEKYSKYFDLHDIEPLCLALVGLLAKKRQSGVVVSETDPLYNFTGDFAGMATRSYSFHFEEVFNNDDLKKVKESGRFESIIEQFERELEKAEKREKEQSKKPVVLGNVKEGEVVLNPISLPHLDEAIDQMEAFVNTEKDKHRKVWAECILESMRKVCWDLEKY